MNGNGCAGSIACGVISGKNVAQIVLADGGLLGRAELVEGEYVDVGFGKPLEQIGQQRALLRLEGTHLGQALRDLLLRRAPIVGQLLHPGDRLLLEAADPLHEKFVEVRRGDGQELHPLEQRIALVERLGKNAPVEREPGEFAIEEQFGRFEIGVDADRCRRTAIDAVGLRERPVTVGYLDAGRRNDGRLARHRRFE